MSSKTNNKNGNSKLHEVKIQNVISTAGLKQPIDITKFNEFPWGRYDIEDNYNGRVAYIKDSKMQGRVTIFQSGKMISTGAKSINQAGEQLTDSMNLMYKNNIIEEIVYLIPLIRNIVATLNIGKKLNLNSLVQNLSKSIYEPDQFPALIFRIPNSATFLIFSSGKIVITGAKSEDELTNSARNIFQMVKEFTYD
jgi:transcription initiation factor TFIID TATA-box-binding protein